ncbi:vacuolar protein sorting-associated protein 37C [Episyrphus balteatus]|uniref:vacuolar protein sorting-associated protein 37C n=1 Tax=Episyrphus balteatus TaxID=286459 RepID=UPI0024854E45|nr:vacuolar protein sorting-associated protein 37C [Episyrphus balteatus]
MYQEYLNHLHVSIAPLSSDELKDLLNDDDKLDEKVDEVLETLRAQKESLLTDNRSRAESNIEKEPILIELRGKVNELLEEGKTRCASVQDKISQIKTKSGNVSIETALALLQTAAAESEEESEKLVKDFIENDLGLEGFLEAFLTSRKKMHLRKFKAEKMSELMRPQNQRNSMYNNLPSTGFYPQAHTQSQVPYPLGPMMPMPRPY